MKRFLLLTLTSLVTFPSAAQTWQHSGPPAQLIELFTSEGCSSCPPADRYIGEFRHSSKLWNSVIPVAYHVDYWDYLGWKDKFANPAFSQKQRLYKAYGVVDSVYTPGFVVDGNEWRGFFHWGKKTLPSPSTNNRGLLTLNREGNRFKLVYSGTDAYTANLVVLALDEVTQVKAGENRGKLLDHHFVALDKLQQYGQKEWQFELQTIPESADAVAVWLTKEGSYLPVQTVAGEFNSK
ncbi:DUF1223 domain-containing protein [Vibrionales bacterium C3R12]|nr:DUF1223 domain-containing protein [Vibrionales bacterium C3R12]